MSVHYVIPVLVPEEPTLTHYGKMALSNRNGRFVAWNTWEKHIAHGMRASGCKNFTGQDT